MTLPWRARMVTAPASCFWSTSFWITECRFSSRSLEKPTDSGLAVGRSAAVLRAMLCRTRMRDRFILGALLYIKGGVRSFDQGFYQLNLVSARSVDHLSLCSTS